MMLGPLDSLNDIRVLDVSHAAAGPYCGALLAELGAQVVKLESPSGDHFRKVQHGAVHANVNRNKRSVCVDLGTSKGQEIGIELSKRCDVLIESFVPGTIERLGLGYDDVVQHNSSVVYISVSGFGQTGPYCNRPGYDVVAQAMSGLMSVTGEADRPPVRVGTSLIDFGTGLFAAFGAVAALRRRERTGEGCHIDASLLETAIGWMNYWFTDFSITKEAPARRGSGLELFAPYQVFSTEDGEVFVGIATNRFFEAFCREFELDILGDPRFASNESRCEHREPLAAVVQRRLLRVPTDEILRRLNRIGVPAAPVLEVPEVLEDPHVLDRDVFLSVDGSGGPMLMPRLPLRFAGEVDRVPEPAPGLGQHTAEVLRELGLSADAIADLDTTGVVVVGKAG
jgi:crotonobetainyl-CoA:carnitine CoA-transferase CaiB-like acyl-CoA transferase